jgi:hypothetical protein
MEAGNTSQNMTKKIINKLAYVAGGDLSEATCVLLDLERKVCAENIGKNQHMLTKGKPLRNKT